jgi:hypothetical protein
MTKLISQSLVAVMLVCLSLALPPARITAWERTAALPAVNHPEAWRLLMVSPSTTEQKRKRRGRRARGIITGRSYINVHGERVPSPRKSRGVLAGATPGAATEPTASAVRGEAPVHDMAVWLNGCRS